MRKEAFDAMLQDLHARVTQGPGELEHTKREAIGAGTEVDPDFTTYVEKVKRHAYKVLDTDIVRLKEAGYSEDAVFEATVAAAVGAGFSRWKIAKSALDEIEEST